MAELETNRSAAKNKKQHRRNTRVDLTPMVDLGFLLITFFVFTTSMTQPTVMQVDMPYDKTPDSTHVCESCVLTVLLDKDNSIKYYEGDITNNPPIGETAFSPEGIRRVLLEKKRAVKSARGRDDQFILIIKPSDASTFQNFVDISDEVLINNIKRYYIDEVTDADKKVLTPVKQ